MRRSCVAGSRERSMLPLFISILGILILSACTPTTIPVAKKASIPDAKNTSTPVAKKTSIPDTKNTSTPVAKNTSTPAVVKAPAQCQPGHQVGFLSTSHSKLVDASSGCQVSLTGVNWFGFETGTFAPHGLWARNWQDMLKQIAQLGFNTLRLPYSNQLFDPSSKPTSKDAGGGIDYTKNPDLAGLSGLEIMDKIIAGAGQRG